LINSIKARSEEIVVASFMLPMLILLTVFVFIPTVQAIMYSFTNQQLLGKYVQNPQFIGLKNFERLVADPAFYQSLKATFEYVSMSFIGRFFIGLTIALLLNAKRFKLKKFMAAFVLIPWIIPGITDAFAWMSMLDTREGLLNRLLSTIGLPYQNWLYNRAMISIVLTNIWCGVAYPSMILLSSAIASIPSEYYEMAEICGASPWFKFKSITLPLMKYPLLLTAILVIKADLDDFTIPYALTGGGPGYRTELIALYAYHTSFISYDLGYGCAVSMILAVIIFILALMQIKLTKAT